MIQAIQFKPTEARYKVGILVGADRMNAQAGNAFLKTLEEPPPRSLLILLSTEPDRLMETLLSRCLRLDFPGQGEPANEELSWLHELTAEFRVPPKSLLGRYRLLDLVLRRLGAIRAATEEDIEARSPAHQYKDVDPALSEQWEVEDKAAVEGEYRRRRADLLRLVQMWLRDVWLRTQGHPTSLLGLPALQETTDVVAARLDPGRAVANLTLLEDTQRRLHTNVQEALALEVAMLRLHL